MSIVNNRGYAGFVECQAIDAKLHPNEINVPITSPFIMKKNPGVAKNRLEKTREGLGSIPFLRR
jgi:hypothetical protein